MKHVVILALLIGGLLWLAAGKIGTTPYGYDEADYMFVASLGYFNNWFDVGTLPIATFVKIGLHSGADPSQRLALSQLVRNSRDPVAYRHWHGPLYYYWLAWLSHWNPREQTVRGWSLLFPILTAIVLYFGTLQVLPRPAAHMAAILSCVLFLWGYMTVMTTEVAPHMLFILCYVTALLLLAKAMSGGGRRYWYGAVIATGLAFCTLEVAFALVATLMVCAYLRRREMAVDWAFAGKSVLTLVATIFLVWPAAFLKLSFLKAYFAMAYLAVFRKSPWGNAGFFRTWAVRFTNSPVEWVAVAAALLVFFRFRLWRQAPALLPFVVYSAFMVLAVLRVNSEGPRYVTPFFPALVIFAGWTAGWMLAGSRTSGGMWRRYASVAALSVLLFFTTRSQMAGYMLHEDPCPQAMIAAIRERSPSARTLLVPQVTVPMLHYYFPQAAVRGYLDEAEIPRAMAADHPDAVLYLVCPVRLETPAGSSP